MTFKISFSHGHLCCDAQSAKRVNSLRNCWVRLHQQRVENSCASMSKDFCVKDQICFCLKMIITCTPREPGHPGLCGRFLLSQLPVSPWGGRRWVPWTAAPCCWGGSYSASSSCPLGPRGACPHILSTSPAGPWTADRGRQICHNVGAAYQHFEDQICFCMLFVTVKRIYTWSLKFR